MLRQVAASAKFCAILATSVGSVGTLADTVYLDCKGKTTSPNYSEPWNSEQRIKLTLEENVSDSKLEFVQVVQGPSMPQLFSNKSDKDDLNIIYHRTLYISDEKIVGVLNINFGDLNEIQKHSIVLDRINGAIFHASDLFKLGKNYATYEFRGNCCKVQKQF